MFGSTESGMLATVSRALSRSRLFLTRGQYPHWFFQVTVAVLLAVGVATVYATGGTQNSLAHLLYVPILITAFLDGPVGAAIVGVAAGLAVGPYMPMDVQSALPQASLHWVYRLIFFVAVGSFAGLLTEIGQSDRQTIKRLFSQVTMSQGQTLRAFAHLVSTRDHQTGGHSERVARNAMAVGRAIALHEEEMQTLYWAAILHDVGKVIIPANILLKPGALTESEFEEVKFHTILGYEMLISASGNFRDIAGIVRAHHERWDGSGYPDGLSMEKIPRLARILAIVDVFEALTSVRPYRGPLPISRATRYMEEETGRLFDPELVRVFLQLLGKGGILVGNEISPEGFVQLPLPIRSE